MLSMGKSTISMAMASSVSHYQSKPPFSFGFPMAFLWFSYVFLGFLWFSYGFPMASHYQRGIQRPGRVAWQVEIRGPSGHGHLRRAPQAAALMERGWKWIGR